MSLASNDLLKTLKNEEQNKETRMAVVTEYVSSKGARVRFYGETESSQMYYKKTSSASFSTGDTVILQRVNNSYIITGRI